MSEQLRRKRSKIACETCRERKRKCDGGQPCGACVRFEYDCFYLPSSTRKRKASVLADQSPHPASIHATSPAYHDALQARHSPPDNLRSLEANSGAAFVRKLALRIDPTNAPRYRLFAWNAFLGSREGAGHPQVRPIMEMMTQADMEALAAVYFKKVDPCYGFIDRLALEQSIKRRWTIDAIEDAHDAVLCGVAALACLFSHVQSTVLELDLVGSAKAILERGMYDVPTSSSVTAWVLRVAYLRMTGTPHMAWTASCILMHMIEAAGLHCEPSEESVLDQSKSSQDISADTRRRVFGVAQHLNIWMSFDTGRSRVTLHNATTIPPTPRPGNFTIELLELLHYSEILDPDRTLDVHELELTLSAVLERDHSLAPLVEAQCNLSLCICRRLQALNVVFTGKLLQLLLGMTAKGIRAAQVMVDTGSPWHHMVNVPFQVVCILLTIDTSASISQLQDAMQCLGSINSVYNTDATQEALRTASLLIRLHQRRKELDASRLNDVLDLYPAVNFSDVPTTFHPQQPEDMRWLDGLMAEIPSLQDLDLEQFLSQGF